MLHRVPCTDKVRDTIGWVPQRTLEDILGDVVADVSAPLNSEVRSMKRLALIFVAFLAVVAAPAAGAAISVGITSPADGSHSLSGIVPVRVSASADFGIYGVQLYVDGQPYGPVPRLRSRRTSTRSVGYLDGRARQHTLAADAIDWSQTRRRHAHAVEPDHRRRRPRLPDVSLTNPPPWTFVRGTVNLSANVTSAGQTTAAVHGRRGRGGNRKPPRPGRRPWNTTTSPDGCGT